MYFVIDHMLSSNDGCFLDELRVAQGQARQLQARQESYSLMGGSDLLAEPLLQH
jgi:hypothetical protein